MRLPKLGPGLLITAAFIGPGTVTRASKAGAETGLSLLWVVAFSVVAVVVLQEMSARLGIVSRRNLSESVAGLSDNRLIRLPLMLLVLMAIAFGNAAYQAGNLSGAAAGLESLVEATTKTETESWVFISAVLFTMATTTVLLWFGSLQWILRFMMLLVGMMSVAFIWTAFSDPPNWTQLAKGLFIPSFQKADLLLVIGLIGTTVVPYNLFLHSQSAKERWPDASDRDLREARVDNLLSISIGGLITASILISSAGVFEGAAGEFSSTTEMAKPLGKQLGPVAVFFFAVGLFSAGLTSSITAPLAAAHVVAGILGWKDAAHSWRFRSVWIAILVIGGTVAIALPKNPLVVIGLAQVANGLLLPLIAGILLWSVNRSAAMGEHRNGWLANLLGIVVILISLGLGLNTIIAGLGKIT